MQLQVLQNITLGAAPLCDSAPSNDGTKQGGRRLMMVFTSARTDSCNSPFRAWDVSKHVISSQESYGFGDHVATSLDS